MSKMIHPYHVHTFEPMAMMSSKKKKKNNGAGCLLAAGRNIHPRSGCLLGVLKVKNNVVSFQSGIITWYVDEIVSGKQWLISY